MKKIRFKAKIIFLTIFVILLGMCIYADAVKSSPRSLVNICILGFMMHAYMEKTKESKTSTYNHQKNFYKKQLNTILENIPIAAFLINTNGKYICGNSEINKLLNKQEENLYGCNVLCKFFGCSQEMFGKMFDFIRNNRQNFYFDHLYKFAQQKKQWYRIYFTPLYNEKEEIENIAVFLKNIGTEMELIRQEQHFIATLSHDLKTPVIAQIRSIELILNELFGKVSPAQKEMLELTLESCNHLNKLISAIQYSYKFDNNEITLAPTDVNIINILTECCAEVSNLAKERQIEIIIKPDLKKNQIKADKKFLKDAILHLIENSISYAYEQTTINVELCDKDEELVLKIHTESPYIPEHLLYQMFDRYLGQTKVYNKIGFCLKLYYTSQIIQAHKGKILAYSDPSNKNTFGFTIPRRREEIIAIA